VQPSSEKLFAVNGSLMHILGTVKLPVTIGEHNSVIKMFVTPDIREPMLSFGWLQENQVCSNFTSNALFMHGVLIPLQMKRPVRLVGEYIYVVTSWCHLAPRLMSLLVPPWM